MEAAARGPAALSCSMAAAARRTGERRNGLDGDAGRLLQNEFVRAAASRGIVRFGLAIAGPLL